MSLLNVQGAVRRGVVVSAACFLLGLVKPVAAQSLGQWHDACPSEWLSPSVHGVHLFNGTVLVWHLGGSDPQLWDPFGCDFNDVPVGNSPIGCAGHVGLKQGSALIVGGGGDNREVHEFTSGTWIQRHSMSTGRFYPTCTVLGDGRVVVLGGSKGGVTVLFPSIYQPVSATDPVSDTWQDMGSSAYRDVGTYPFVFLLQSGKVAVVSAHEFGLVPVDEPAILDVTTQQWTELDTHSFVSEHGSAVMYRPGKVLKCGGAVGGPLAIPDTDTIDFNVPTPTWAGNAPDMVRARLDHNLVVLADGKVLAVGGWTELGEYVHEAELIDPNASFPVWQLMASMNDGRAYHSSAVLLPDATVLAAGEGQDVRGEIYTPPYLPTGSLRPVISFAPAGASYGASFSVRVDAVPAGQINKVNLVRLAAVTHGFDQDQRCVPLSFAVVNSVTLRVTAPANGNAAPPGYYMLFLVSNAGVPSKSTYLQLIPPA